MPTGPDLSWLSAWLAGPVRLGEALSRFDGLSGVVPDEVTGLWRGRTLATGHPLDGLLETLGWYGKSVETPEHVHPLLFRQSGRIVPLSPALMPTGIALRWPGLSRSHPVRFAFAALGPFLHTRRHAARLGLRDYRGRHGTALIYHDQPIADHLRRVAPDRLIGLMERKGMDRPFVFLLTREPSTTGQAEQGRSPNEDHAHGDLLRAAALALCPGRGR